MKGSSWCRISKCCSGMISSSGSYPVAKYAPAVRRMKIVLK
jgi:hypothetical protein